VVVTIFNEQSSIENFTTVGLTISSGHAVAQLVEALRDAGSIPDGIIGIFR
jgi:hypothetical protein